MTTTTEITYNGRCLECGRVVTKTHQFQFCGCKPTIRAIPMVWTKAP